MERADQRFPKSHRLLNRSAFRRVYDKGQKVHGRYFTAFVLSSEAPGVRLGLTVTRKVGKSVERNRCRRMLREAFRRHRTEAVGVGAEVVINAKREMTAAPYAEIETELIKLLSRIRR